MTNTKIEQKDEDIEYIIVDSNNNWLSTCGTLDQAKADLKMFTKMRKNEEDFSDMVIGEDIYIYKAIEVN